MKKLFAPVLLVLFVVVFSCAPSRQELLSKVTELENTFNAILEKKLDLKVANALLEAYDEFIINFQQDSLAPEYLFRAGKLALKIKKTSIAEEYLKLYLANYPKSIHEDDVLFGLANIYENQMMDIETAEKYYNRVIAEYPDSKYAVLAKQSLGFLGKTADEILDMILKPKLQADTLTHNTSLDTVL